MTERHSCITCGRLLLPDALSGQCPSCLLSLGISSAFDHSGAEQHCLLFAVFALRLGLVDAGALRKHRDAQADLDAARVAEVLADEEVIHEGDRRLVVELASLTADHFGGDDTLAFESLGGWLALKRLWSDYDTGVQSCRSGDVVETAGGHTLQRSLRYSTLREMPGRYTDPREQSRGGMGLVFFVRDEYLDRDVALKELIPLDEMAPAAARDDHSGSVSAQMVSRFLREARLTGLLEHPSIIPVYELGRRSNGALYYTMKLVRGRTLEQALQGAATLSERLDLLPHFLDLCQAIGYAHSKHVIHRDIKPSNVMIGEFGETVIIDWGLAKVVGGAGESEPSSDESTNENLAGAPEVTKAGTRLGTPRYMSPEQTAGLTEKIDQRSDVFSLGVVLYELLTGRTPFNGAVTEEIFHQIHNEEPAPVCQIEPGAPPELAVICAHAMRKNAKDRYPTAKEFADEIQRFKTGAIVRSYNYTVRETLGRFYALHRPMMNTAAVSVAVIVGLALFSYWNVRAARDEAVSARNEALAARDSATLAQREAEAQRGVAERALDEADLERRLAESAHYVNGIALARYSIEQGKVLQAREDLDKLPTELRNWEWNYLAALAWPAENSGTAISEEDGDEGKSAADAWDGAHARAILTIQAHGAEVTGVQFSADGRRLATKSSDGSAAVWDVVTGKKLVTIEGTDGNYGPALLIEGDRYVARSKGIGEISVCDTATGSEKAILQGHTEAAIPISSRSDGPLLASVGLDMKFRIWHWPTQRQISEVSANPEFWNSGSMAHFYGSFVEGKKFFRTIWDKSTIREWDYETGEIRSERVLPAAPGYVLHTLDPEGATAVLANPAEQKVQFKSVESGLFLAGIDATLGPGIGCVFYGGDGSLVGVRTDDGRILLFRRSDVERADNDTTAPIAVISDLSNFVWYQAAALSPDGRTIAVPQADGVVRIFAPTDNVFGGAAVMLRHRDTVLQAYFEDDSRYVVTGSFDGRLQRWDLATGEIVQKMKLHEGPLSVFFPSPDFRYWISSSYDQTQKIVDLRAEEILFEGRTDLPPAFAGGGRGPLMKFRAAGASRHRISPDGRLWLRSGGEGELVVARVPSNEAVLVLPGHGARVYRPEFTPDGAAILAHGYQQLFVNVWDASTGELRQILEGTGPVMDTTVTPDGRYAAVAYINGRVRVWDLRESKQRPAPLKDISVHRGSVYTVDVDPSGTYLASASADSHAMV